MAPADDEESIRSSTATSGWAFPPGGSDALFPRYARPGLRLERLGLRPLGCPRWPLPRLALPGRFERTEPVPEPPPTDAPDQHWIEFRFLDAAGRALASLPYRIELPDGSEQKGTLDADGSARYAPQPEGFGTIRLSDIERAGWSASEIDAHESAELTIRTTGIDPGTAVRFEVFRLYRERSGDALATLDGQLDEAGTASATWKPEATDAPGDRFVFKARVEKVWRTSAPITVRHEAVAAEWSPATARDGDPVALRVRLRGVADGESASIRIVEKRWRDGEDVEVGRLSATVTGGALEASWPIPPAAAPPARGDSGRRDFYYTVEAGGLLYCSDLLAALPREEGR
jgi:hypothetical protein